MLILTRYPGQGFVLRTSDGKYLGKVVIVGVRSGYRVAVGFELQDDVKVLREEISSDATIKC